MEKVERVILRLGNNSTTQRKLNAINKFMLDSGSSWCWGKCFYYAGEARKFLTSAELSELAESLSKTTTDELYVIFDIEYKSARIGIMDPDTELIAPSNYWITCTEHLSFEFADWGGTVGEAFSKVSERLSEFTITIDAAKESMLSARN